MSVQSAFSFVLDFLGKKPVVLEVSQAQLSSDAGLLPILSRDCLPTSPDGLDVIPQVLLPSNQQLE